MSPEGIPKRNALFGFVPKHLDVGGRPEFDLFPFNILFAGFKIENGKTIMGSAVYEPDLSTFKIKKGVLSMKYNNIYGENWVMIEYNLITKCYSGIKYVIGEAGRAIGMDWDMFFVRLTMLGLFNSESCKFEILSPEEGTLH